MWSGGSESGLEVVESECVPFVRWRWVWVVLLYSEKCPDECGERESEENEVEFVSEPGGGVGREEKREGEKGREEEEDESE